MPFYPLSISGWGCTPERLFSRYTLIRQVPSLYVIYGRPNYFGSKSEIIKTFYFETNWPFVCSWRHLLTESHKYLNQEDQLANKLTLKFDWNKKNRKSINFLQNCIFWRTIWKYIKYIVRLWIHISGDIET